MSTAAATATFNPSLIAAASAAAICRSIAAVNLSSSPYHNNTEMFDFKGKKSYPYINISQNHVLLLLKVTMFDNNGKELHDQRFPKSTGRQISLESKVV
jgi:hypothetical protein